MKKLVGAPIKQSISAEQSRNTLDSVAQKATNDVSSTISSVYITDSEILQAKKSFEKLLKKTVIKSGLDSEELSFIANHLKGKQVLNRIYFIRHGESVQEGLKQTDDAVLSDNGVSTIQAQANFLKGVGSNDKNSSIMWSNGRSRNTNVVRVEQTAGIIVQTLGLNSAEGADDFVYSDTTQKEFDEFTRLTNANKNTAIMMQTIPFVLKERGLENQNIVIVIHKSNMPGIRQMLNPQKIYDLNCGGLKTGQIYTVDFTADGKLVGEDDRSQITLTKENYEGIISLLENQQIEKLDIVIQKFRKGVVQLLELQNYINACFVSDPELIKTYLLSDSFDLRVFCVVNFIKVGNLQVVLENLVSLMSKFEGDKLVEFIKIVYVNLNEKDKILFIQEIRDSVEGSVAFNKLKETDSNLINFINYVDNIRPAIQYLRKRSLDERIVGGESISMSVELSGDKYPTINSLIEGNGVVMIQGDAGSGKSIKLLEILEYSIENNKYPLYIHLGKTKFEDIKSLLVTMQSTKKADLILFDALDESTYTNEEKKQLFELLKELGKKQRVVITSRFESIQFVDKEEENSIMKNIDFVKVKPLSITQIDEYVNSKFDDIQRQGWENIKNSEFIKDLESNPLMLNMICNLIILGEDLEKISCKADIYSRIVDMRLRDWEEIKDSRKISVSQDSKNYKPKLEKLLKTKKIFLCRVAYETMIGSNSFTENSLNDLLLEYDLINDIECLNLIFKVDQEGNYDFVHESFREYFCAEYVMSLSEGERILALKTYFPLYKIYRFYGEDNLNIFLEKILSVLNSFDIKIEEFFIVLIGTGDVDAIKYFINESGLNFSINLSSFWGIDLFRNILNKHDLKLLKVIVERFYDEININNGGLLSLLSVYYGRSIDGKYGMCSDGNSKNIRSIIKFLIIKFNKKIDINLKDINGDSIFLFVCKNHSEELIPLLIDLFGDNIDINSSNNDGETVLMLSVTRVSDGSLFPLQLLLQKFGKKIQINKTNKYGDSALMIACKNGNYDLIKLLVEEFGEEIDINIHNFQGETALSIAYGLRNKDILKYLIKKSAKGQL